MGSMTFGTRHSKKGKQHSSGAYSRDARADTQGLSRKLRKYKGGVVFQGNQVMDQTATYAETQEAGSSALSMSASKVSGAVATSPGFVGGNRTRRMHTTRQNSKGNDMLPSDRPLVAGMEA